MHKSLQHLNITRKWKRFRNMRLMTAAALLATALSAYIPQKVNHANGIYYLEFGLPVAFIRQELHLSQDIISEVIHRHFYLASCLENPTEIIWSGFFVDVLCFLALISTVCHIAKNLVKANRPCI